MKGKKTVSFDVDGEDHDLILDVVDRAMKLAKKLKVNYSPDDCEMDLSACVANGNPLRLADLLKADDGNFGHDIFGIRRFLNRETGQLEGHFRPRFSAKK